MAVITRTRPDNCIIMLFGGAGDLTHKKLIPALYHLFTHDMLPVDFAIIATDRVALDDTSYQDLVKDSLKGEDTTRDKKWIRDFQKHFYYVCADVKSSPDYALLKAKMHEVDKAHHGNGNCLFYMAMPPSFFEVIAQNLAAQKMNKGEKKGQWRRIVVEKPFGYDLQSALELNKKLLQFFSEDQVYRIDHYLGKETVQNVLVLRFSNGIFEPLWNRNYIHHVEITAAEFDGIGERAGYYDGAGALRDMVQNHLLQILGLVAMEPPASLNPTMIHNESLQVFESLRPFSKEDVRRNVIRGQYTASTIKKQKIKSYRQEKGIGNQSRTETYAAMKFYIDNWRWGGVPFYIRTGKRLPSKVTEVMIHFKTTPHRIFKNHDGSVDSCNRLLIRIQPEEGVLLKFDVKTPGLGYETQNVNMDFRYAEIADRELLPAYERLIHDCILGDSTLFTRGDVVEACWKFIDPILTQWKRDPDLKLYGYPAGTWGPQAADALFDGQEEAWSNPCADLAKKNKKEKVDL